ncbi:MAG: hypothetical protein AAGI12_02745 [Pseudomonadota bacterium]
MSLHSQDNQPPDPKVREEDRREPCVKLKDEAQGSAFARARGYMPKSRAGRMVVGVALVIGGIFGFLPIVGFWMLPLGLLVLSVDFPTIRRFRRRCQVRLMRWWKKRTGR